MTPFEEFMTDVDKAVRTFASENKSKYKGTGIPQRPDIQVDEVTLEQGQTNLQMKGNAPQAQAGVIPAGGGPPVDPMGACTLSGVCFLTTQAHCLALGGTYAGDGTTC